MKQFKFIFLFQFILLFNLHAQITILEDGKIGIGTETPDSDIQINAENIKLGGNKAKNAFMIGQYPNDKYVGIMNSYLTGINDYALAVRYDGLLLLNAAKSLYGI